MEKKLIGRIDICDFPEINLNNVKIKIDTGAYSSSIHCDIIREIDVNKIKKLEVVFLDPRNHAYNGKIITFDSYRKKLIKSSNGIIEERYIVSLEIKLFSKLYRTDFSLTNREMLKYPVLIGRKLLNKNFVVDTQKINLSNHYKHIE